VDGSWVQKKQQALLAGCVVLSLFVIIVSLWLMFSTAGAPELPVPPLTLEPRTFNGSSVDELHITLLNISYSRLVADTPLSGRVIACLQESIASLAKVLQPNDVHVVLSRALDGPDLENRSDGSGNSSSSNVDRTTAVLASVLIPANLSRAAALDNDTKLHLLRNEATSGLCFVDGIDEVTTGHLAIVVEVTGPSASTSRAAPTSQGGAKLTSQAAPTASSLQVTSRVTKLVTTTAKLVTTTTKLATTTFEAQPLSTSARLTTRSSQAMTTARARTTPMAPPRPKNWLDRYRLRLHGRGQLLAVQVRLISGLATGALDTDQTEKLAACLAQGLARQLDVAAGAIKDLGGRSGALSMSRKAVLGLRGPPAIVADGRIQLPPQLAVAIAAQAVEDAKASSALEDAASRLLVLRASIHAAGGLGAIEIFAGLSRLDRFSRLDRNVNGFLDLREFSEAAHIELTPPLARHEIRTVYQMLDTNQDGQLDSDEFFARASRRTFVA